MQVKLSELRKIIREELHRDYAKSLYEAHCGGASHDRKNEEDKEEEKKEAVDETVDETVNAEILSDDDDDDDRKDEALPAALGRAALGAIASYGSGKAMDKFFKEEKEVKELEVNQKINESLDFDRFSRLWKK